MDQARENTTILVLFFVGVLMGAHDVSIVSPGIPAIEKYMQIHNQNVSWIFNVYLLFYLPGLPVLYKLSKTHSQKSIYTVSLAVFGFGSLLVLLSHDFTLLLIGQVLQGLGLIGVFPVTIASKGKVYPVVKPDRGLGTCLALCSSLKYRPIKEATNIRINSDHSVCDHNIWNLG